MITHIDLITKKAVCENVTTLRSHSDTTCVLKVGDHPFIPHDSVLNYSDAREMPIDLVEKALKCGTTSFVCEPHEPCRPDVLARIQQGLLDSKQTPKMIKELCRRPWQK